MLGILTALILTTPMLACPHAAWARTRKTPQRPTSEKARKTYEEAEQYLHQRVKESALESLQESR
jgi:hypothetical protein